MNILHVESSLNWGGQEYRTVNETRWLNASGHRAWIACNPGSELGRRVADVCVAVRMRNSCDARAAVEIAGHCRRLGIDVVHVHSPKDAWICYSLHLAGIPVVRSRQITNPVKAKWSRSIVYRRGCAKIIATADCIRRDLIARNRVAPDRITVVGEGVDTNEYRPDVDGSAFRSEFGVAPDVPLFGVVAMIRPEKGHLIFIEAATEMLSSHPRARFAIVGEGTGRRVAENEVSARLRFGGRSEKSGPIFMTGYRTDTPAVMAALDVLVVPSTAEAQSLVVPQAFASGRAVIASNVGGLPELVRHRDTGLLVPPGDSPALAAAMRLLADEPCLRARLARNGLRFACAQLSFDSKMAQNLAVYDEVAAPRTARARRASPVAHRKTMRSDAARLYRRLWRAPGMAAVAALVLWLGMATVRPDFFNGGFLGQIAVLTTAAPGHATNVLRKADTLDYPLDDDDDDDLVVLPDDDVVN